METESEEREACLRRHRERDGARWASPTVDQTQARLEHNASYRHTHLLPLTVSEGWRVRWQKRVIHDSFSLLFQYFSRIYARAMFVSHAPWICQPLIRPPWHEGALSNGGSLPSQQRRERLVFIN